MPASENPKPNLNLDNDEAKAPEELNAVVDELLSQLSNKFSEVSSELLNKMDDMSKRIDHLEATIQAGQPKNTNADAGK